MNVTTVKKFKVWNTYYCIVNIVRHCRKPRFIFIFYAYFCQYVENFNDKRACTQKRELLNVNRTCSAENKEKAKESICMYIKKTYYNLNNKVNNL